MPLEAGGYHGIQIPGFSTHSVKETELPARQGGSIVQFGYRSRDFLSSVSAVLLFRQRGRFWQP